MPDSLKWRNRVIPLPGGRIGIVINPTPDLFYHGVMILIKTEDLRILQKGIKLMISLFSRQNLMKEILSQLQPELIISVYSPPRHRSASVFISVIPTTAAH